jgi:hypothetical protein
MGHNTEFSFSSKKYCMSKSSAPKQPKISLLQTMSVLAILGVLAWAFIQFVLIEAQPKPMTVKVTLDNRCGIVEGAFIAVADNGVSAPFDGGVAVLPTYSNARIAVKNSTWMRLTRPLRV